jgi:hypothetical protein
MAHISLEQFSGIAPRVGPTELGPTQAQTATNVKLQSGEIRPWRQAVSVYVPGNAGVQTIYKFENTATNAFVWLEWTTDVNVVPGPVADTSDFRLFYTGDGTPKKTNWNLATTSGTGTKPFPDAYYQMGVPAPTGAPTLVKSGGSGTVHEDRVYVYTYVSTFGAVLEESAPSPPASISTVEPNATVTVSAFSTAPTTAAGYNITAIRIYRAVAGTTSINYYYVGQVTVTPATGVATGTFADTVLSANLGVILTSLYYTPPPSTLSGLVTMPNGILAGFTGNQVWFCEPYLPHAWPSIYTLTVDDSIVGLGVFGQSLVVCTSRRPYVITGSTPGSMTQEKLTLFEPCSSKKSIASDQYGVLYASPNGIVSIGQGMQEVVTRALFTRDEWSTYLPATMVGVIYQNMYLAFYSSGNTNAALVITRGDNPPLVTLQLSASCIFIDRTTANVFYVNSTDNKIYQLDADPVNNIFFEWKSKKFVLPSPTNFAAFKLQADWVYLNDATSYNAALAVIIAANQAIWTSGVPLQGVVNGVTVNGLALNGSILTPLPAAADLRNVNVIINADDAQLYGNGVTSQEPVRLPAANKNYVYEIKLTGNAPIRQFRMATGIAELRQT